MDQLAMLWQYQVEDRKADKLEQELSRSPLRQKMNTCRTQFNAKQKQYKQMEEQVAILSDRKDAIRDAIPRCEEQAIVSQSLRKLREADLVKTKRRGIFIYYENSEEYPASLPDRITSR